jgi:endonuclease YncB( thermonuclease family)
MRGRFLLVVVCTLGLFGAFSGMASTHIADLFVLNKSAPLPDAPGYPSVDWAALPLWTVTSVRDADTLTLHFPDAGVSVEADLAGIKAPGLRQPFGSEAAFFTRTLLEGEQVRVAWLSTDHLPEGSRRQAVLYRDPDGLCINLELVRAGLAEARSPAMPPEPGAQPVEQTSEVTESQPSTVSDGEAAQIDPMSAVLAVYAQRAVALQRNALGGGEPICAHPAGTNALVTADNSNSQADPATKDGDNTDTPPADQPTVDARQLVYLTPSGSKYHTSGCRFVSATSRSMPLAEAKGQYQPCRVCKPAE